MAGDGVGGEAYGNKFSRSSDTATQSPRLQPSSVSLMDAFLRREPDTPIRARLPTEPPLDRPFVAATVAVVS